jgi:hypothetical protein
MLMQNDPLYEIDGDVEDATALDGQDVAPTSQQYDI